MKRQTAFLLILTLTTITALAGCGGKPAKKTDSTPTSASTASIFNEPTTPAPTEAYTIDPTYETIYVDPDTHIIALDYCPYIKGLNMKVSLDELISRYGSDYTHNEGANSYIWYVDNGGRILATSDEDNPKLINSVDYAPPSYEAWRDSNNDFSQVNVNASYTYAELYSIVKTPGTAFRVSTDLSKKKYYFVCWYDENGTVLYAQFNAATNKTVHISII